MRNESIELLVILNVAGPEGRQLPECGMKVETVVFQEIKELFGDVSDIGLEIPP